MSRFDLEMQPTRLPTPHFDVARRLEDLGIPAWQQGDTLVEGLLSPPGSVPGGGRPEPAAWPVTRPTHVLLCAASATAVLEALPRAVVTSSGRRRFSLGTAAGPIDLLPLGDEPVSKVLPGFGLGALAFAWRPVDAQWCDPSGSRALLSQGRLDLASDADAPNPFRVAPRRYWIAARLLAQYTLEATPRLVDAAREALDDCRRRVPEGGPARREIHRVLAAPDPTTGLRFLHDVGICEALFPGMEASGAEIVGELDRDPSLRWAAWLAGASTQRALRRLRMPLSRARPIERLLRHHPIDRTTADTGDAGVRRIRQRLHPEEIESLLTWRGHQLDRAEQNPQTHADRSRLEQLRERLGALADQLDRVDRVKSLAIDGQSVMAILGQGPGRHVGEALAHLASIVDASPDENEPERLEARLREWADRRPK
jgi:tRNA nucleotidyltransferase (CCA-adding enzyme)